MQPHKPMNSLVFRKRNHRAEIPAFSNRDIYELIYGKKPRQKKGRLWRKLKQYLYQGEQWLIAEKRGSAFAICCVLIALVLLSQWPVAQQMTFAPLLPGALSLLCMLAYNKMSPDTLLFSVSGVLAIVLAVLLPVFALNMSASIVGAAYYLPAHLAFCGIAARYRSDQNLESVYIFHKAVSYFVFTLTTGWLSYYSLSNW